ncbi:hypothetical protein Tco_0570576 [Tanacetum coccineum]
MTRNCRTHVPATTQRPPVANQKPTITCFRCGAQGNFKSKCLRLKNQNRVIMESLVKKKQKGAILELKRRHLKNTIFCTYTPYPAMKIRRISASSAQETRNDQFSIRCIHYNQYAVCTAVHQLKIRI